MDSQPLYPGAEFIHGVPIVCAVNDSQVMQPDTLASVYRYQNGKEWHSQVVTWVAEGSEGATRDCIWYYEKLPLDFGDLRFKMFLENEIIRDLTSKNPP